MSRFITAILLSVIIAQTGIAQQKKGYASVGASTLIVKDFNNKASLNAGIGFMTGQYFSAGVAFDLFIFKDPKFVIPKADFRIYPMKNDNEVSPFVALQPGYVMYNQGKVKGAASIDLLLGVMARPVQKKGIGVNLAVGYSKFGFKTEGVAAYNDAVKIQAGILF